MKSLPTSSIERLEARIAPATISANGKNVMWTDIDGDAVTLHSSKAIFSSKNLDTVLTFTNSGSGQQLQVIDLTQFFDKTLAADINLSVTATKPTGGTGDGKVNVGFIKAAIPDPDVFAIRRGVDLGTITIDGDLGGIYAGDQFADAAVQEIHVDSWGKLNSAEQAALTDGTLPENLHSIVLGPIKKIVIADDFDGSDGARLQVLGGIFGKIGQLRIGGDLIGGAADDSGQIFVTKQIGKITVSGSVTGGAGEESGSIVGYQPVQTTFGDITIKGSIQGGAGDGSGLIRASHLSAVDVTGSVSGYAGNAVDSTVGAGSGSIQGRLQSLHVDGSIVGGTANASGSVLSAGPVQSIIIDGNVTGGGGDQSGVLGLVSLSSFGSVQKLVIGHNASTGNVTGGSGDQSGRITAYHFGNVHLFGSITGGGSESGALTAGRFAPSSPFVLLPGSIDRLTLDGSLVGGNGAASGLINGGHLSHLQIGGSITGGTASSTGGVIATQLGTATVEGNLTGGSVSSGTVYRSGFIAADSIQNLHLVGNLVAGELNGGTSLLASGAITATGKIQQLTIDGAIDGNANVAALISAQGALTGPSSMALQKLTVGGNVDHANILAGYNASSTSAFGTATNSDAQIGSILFKQTVSATNIVAGATAGTDEIFGTADDTIIADSKNSPKLVASIASIIIQGQAETGSSGSGYGIVAEHLRSIEVHGAAVTLQTGANNDRTPILIPGTTDFHAVEVAAATPSTP